MGTEVFNTTEQATAIELDQIVQQVRGGRANRGGRASRGGSGRVRNVQQKKDLMLERDEAMEDSDNGRVRVRTRSWTIAVLKEQ